MTGCARPGCGGEVDETDYCDSCGHPPEAAPPPRALTPLTSSSSGGGRSHGDDDPASLLPVFDFPEPSSRLLREFPVPEGVRHCANPDCVDRRALPSRPSGFCLACGRPFSFLPGLEPGVLVGGQYRVKGCIARGGLGWIHLANDIRLDDNPVVLKGLIDAGDADLATTERQALTAIDHPNIVRIFNFVSHPDPHGGSRAYIVMEYVDGLVLSEVARRSRDGERPPPLGEPLRVEHVIAVGLQILAAFEYLHDRGLLYCDLKPDNVIVRSGRHGGRGSRVKLIDLGGVRRVGDRTSPITGTAGYQVSRAEIDQRGLTVASEIHTVGETLRRLHLCTADRTGRYGVDVEQRHVAVGVESFTRVCARAAHPDPDRRFPSAGAMAGQLRGTLREIASLRDGRARPEESALFHPTATLLDDGLGAVPPLRRWTDRHADTPLTDLPLSDGRPTPSAVAVGLPVPRVFPDDPAEAFLTAAAADDPHRLLDKLARTDLDTIEVALTRCRAALAAGDPVDATESLSRARAFAGGREDWRTRWHEGLLRLTRTDTTEARRCFDAVYDALPGEVAPKLALAYCAEHAGHLDRAESLYLAVWRRDRSVVSAAFGLARGRLARGDRAGALAALDETPDVSRHFDAARIAGVLVLSGILTDGRRPSATDLSEAAERLSTLYLDGGAPSGQSRVRLDTVLAEARLGVLRAGGGGDEAALRSGLERSYRALARQADTRERYCDLVDLANEHRPYTFL